jgi:hypothetical protein
MMGTILLFIIIAKGRQRSLKKQKVSKKKVDIAFITLFTGIFFARRKYLNSIWIKEREKA